MKEGIDNDFGKINEIFNAYISLKKAKRKTPMTQAEEYSCTSNKFTMRDVVCIVMHTFDTRFS